MSSESGDTDEEVNTGESSSSGDQGDEDCVTENEIKPPKLLKSKVVLESTAEVYMDEARAEFETLKCIYKTALREIGQNGCSINDQGFTEKVFVALMNPLLKLIQEELSGPFYDHFETTLNKEILLRFFILLLQAISRGVSFHSIFLDRQFLKQGLNEFIHGPAIDGYPKIMFNGSGMH